MAINTKPPLPPPFPIGTRLKCVDPQSWRRISVEVNGKTVVLYGHGLEVVVDGVTKGRQGTGRLVDEIDGERIYDETIDQCSVYHVEGAPDHGRLIRHDGAKNWKVVKKKK